MKTSKLIESTTAICCNGWLQKVSLTYGSLQLLPWNEDTIIVKMDSFSWFCQTTLLSIYIFNVYFFQYIQTSFLHAWKQGGIIISNFDISLLQFLFCKNTVNLKECVTAFALLFYYSSKGWLQLELWIKYLWKKGWLQVLVPKKHSCLENARITASGLLKQLWYHSNG